MTAEQVFSIANAAAVLCWILLALLPDRRWVTDVLTGKAAPALFAITYIVIVIAPDADVRPDGLDYLHGGQARQSPAFYVEWDADARAHRDRL